MELSECSTVICRYSGTTVDCVTADVGRHLDSEEHKQKEKVTDVYYRAQAIGGPLCNYRILVDSDIL